LFPDQTIQHAGAVVGIGGFAAHPFLKLREDANTPFGRSSWTRNYTAVTGACLLMRRGVFDRAGGFDERMVVCGSDVDLCLRAQRQGLRVVYTPHARLIHHESATRGPESIPEGDFWLSYLAYRPHLSSGDPYYNVNLTLTAFDCGLRSDDRTGEEMALEALGRWLPSENEALSGARARQRSHVADHLPEMTLDERSAAEARRVAPERIAALRRKGTLDAVTWFVPHFGHTFGGIHTILRFGDLLRRRHAVRSTFVIYDNPSASPADYDARASSQFPELAGGFHVLRDKTELAKLPPCDLAIATLWSSAFIVRDFPHAVAKAYFVQDFEPLFYPAGTYQALAEQTYRFGLYGIFNSPGLHEFVTANFPMTGCFFEPAVDSAVFHDRRPARVSPVRVFFYGRPSSDRNGFELGVAALRGLKASLGTQVEILSAGEEWQPEAFQLNGVVENLGVLPYEKTADLYRTCDIGLCFMFTKHPSYLPLEMMACGVTVVTNQNSANRWLLEDEKNCLLAEPACSSVLDRLLLAARDSELRRRLGLAAAERMRTTTWEAQVARVHDALTHGS
jgi:glycosyltransferase involved in cell wall biosynthesis